MDWLVQKAEQEKERVEIAQILNIYLPGTGLCVYFLKDFAFDVMLDGLGSGLFLILLCYFK